MDDLLQWLDAQFDEDERIARAATQGPWSVDNEEYAEAIHGGDLVTAVVGGGRWGGEASVFESTEDALHIAEHDPARVLREIEAKRQLVRGLLEYEAQFDYDRGCAHTADQIASGQYHKPKDILGLRLIASVYSNRPGYREEWRP